MSQPTNIAAFLNAQGANFSVSDAPLPIPGPGEVLVRNRAVALNPTDWKRQSWGLFAASYPAILGSGTSPFPLPIPPTSELAPN